ncbi:MAG: reverse transcriptase domain-containing protein [Sweet potato little leaf phytoplasma]|nr:reverse transcriptase domain-containing protein [Sweet potato little leaf phytoplasma]
MATPQWKQAMDCEYAALQKNKTWTLVPASPSLNVVGNKWIFRIKRNVDGSIQRYKARLVAKGFHQSPGVDFFETFSPVVKASTIRVVLSLAVSRGWSLRQLDFKNAFLNGTLDEDVYMTQPSGYEDPAYPNHICKLNKAIYGLKQAPRVWTNTLKTALLAWGFVNSRSDSSLYIYRVASDVILLLVYVDDVVVTGNNDSLISRLINVLDNQFAFKDLGSLSYFLGIQVHSLSTGLLLNQEKYVSDLLQKLDLEDIKPAPSPCLVGKHLSISEGTPLSDPYIYRSTIGALQYLTHTRLDIAYIVNHLSQFLKQPTDIHWQVVKRVLRYISGTRHLGLLIQPSADLSISAFSDADWASNIDDRKSIAAYCVFLGENLVSWSSKKQNAIARSSTESLNTECWLMPLLRSSGYSNC